MKRIGDLYDSISNYENLLLAFYKAARRKRNRNDVRQFEFSLHENIYRLRNELLDRNVQLGDYHFFTIYDPKERRICAAAFRERVLHHAVINVVGEYLERSLIDQSFACRKGKGQIRAARLACEFARQSPFFLRLDMRKYFDSIDHRVITNQLRRIFKDEPLMSLFEELINTYCTVPGRGLPIGNLTSQYLANLYLSPFDHFVKQQLAAPGFVRYMDDVAIWGTRDQVRNWRNECIEFLSSVLHLQTKRGGFINRSSHGCQFLGYRVYPKRLRLSRSSARRLRTKTRGLEDAFERLEIGEGELQQRSTSLYAFASTADSLNLRRRIISESRLDW